jgi:DTW domain-containing protein YfiP
MREFSTPQAPLQASCPECWKPENYCVCSARPALQTKMRFLILQHPRESKALLGSARLMSLALPESTVHRVGLSWRSLNNALGSDSEIPSEWAVLYLGTQKGSAPLRPNLAFEVRDRRGKALPRVNLKGIVLLDGNWKQSKTLWWRNPWLLKLNRLLLNPTQASRYGTLRKQPRERCLSTLEAGAETLHAVGEEKASEALFTYFETFVEKAASNPRPSRAAAGKPPKPAVPPPASLH